MPPPEPRSRTVSPAFSLARAVGFPQPKEAWTASSGISPVWLASYRFEVIGSTLLPSSLALAPQQELPPAPTRNAAWPYFSFTISLISMVFLYLFAQRDNRLGLDGLVAGAAFGVEKAEQFLQRRGVSRVPEKRTLAADLHQFLI